ncbi:hypothetical protein L3Y34_011896 [Caenorhabditis briggsae]|uniref:EGF-like domain-containing protein n=1 Tax=Caenorhabditis briggsae TaxID=6238 RepID=A0AAE9CV24_CAEBR|nr:hypothetical protein L3Y34_011896 [Caenorhabditis briggsae]
MNLKLLLSLLFIVWRSTSADEFTNHWRATEDVANVQFCSHDSYNKDGSCVCDVDYTGNFCLNRKCRSFGFDGYLPKNPVKVDRCICPPGFLGRNCEPVSCVSGKSQVYSSLKTEKTISLLASYNVKLQKIWENGDIGQLICNETDYARNFNYNYENATLYTKNENSLSCVAKLNQYLTADSCTDDDEKPIACIPLDINNLNSIVQYSPPNSIVFVVTNMAVSPITGDIVEDIIATSIARRIQINVLVYNNTGFQADDPSLATLSNIAAATLGQYILPSIENGNEQYAIVNALLENWDQGYQPTKVFTGGIKTLPVDTSKDIYVAAQLSYGQNAFFSVDLPPTVVQKTDFWKLYKLTAGSYHPQLSASNQTSDTPIIVYTTGDLVAYSAFTSDENRTADVVDSAFSVSVNQTSYSMVVKLESENAPVDYEAGYRTIGNPSSISLDTTFHNRAFCQFNFIVKANCKSVGASVVTMITANNRNSVSFPVYCASFSYAKKIYNNFAAETQNMRQLEFEQSFSKDFACGSDIAPEKTGERSFIIVAENSNDTNVTKSSVDNLFRNKNSFFYQLIDPLTLVPSSRYSNFLAVLTNGETYQIKQHTDYGKFMTKVLSYTNTSSSGADVSVPISVKDMLVDAIENGSLYSDILFVVNFNVSMSANDSLAIKTALGTKRSKLFVLFVQSYTQYGSDVYQYMNDLAIASGGIAVRLDNYDELHTFFTLYFPTLIANDIVAKAYSSDTKPGIALNNVYLQEQKYYLLLTNEDSSEDGPVNGTIQNENISVASTQTIGELQLLTIQPQSAGVYNIPIRFATPAKISNAILYATTDSTDIISLSFVDKDGKNRNDVEYQYGAFRPVIYSTTPFNSSSQISITYSDPANPAKPIYNGSIIPVEGCEEFKWTTNYDWICSVSGGLYHVKIDSPSNSVTRTFPITCLGPDAGGCLNGGHEEGGVCSCPLEWSGNSCQTPNCLNGGTVTTADTCACNPAFTGSFCESSVSACNNVPSQPDYRSDLSSLTIVADVKALVTGGLTDDFGVTGVPITVILYGDDISPRIVESTTNSMHLLDSLKNRTSTAVSPSTSPADSDMYAAMKLALDNQLTNRALFVVYTSNADVSVNSDFLIRLATRRAEVRVLSVAGTESQNSLALSLVGNGIPFAVKESTNFQKYMTVYVGPLFQSLGYTANKPQRVFNVFKTDVLTGPTTVTIPKDSTFDNARVDAFVHVYNGRVDSDNPIGSRIGNTNIYHIKDYDPKVEQKIQLNLFTINTVGYYAIELVGYSKTAYGFNDPKDNPNGANEMVNSGVSFNEVNLLHIYSTPFDEIAPSNPGNFPYLSIKEILGNGTLSAPTTLLFTRKSSTGCFFKYFTTLDVCSQSGTVGYQVQLTTRASATENRQQQFSLTCFKTEYQDGSTVCQGPHRTSSPNKDCDCDSNWGGIDCTEPVCANGVRDMSICRCPVDFYGLRCEQSFGLTSTTTAGPSTSAASTSSSTQPASSSSPSQTTNSASSSSPSQTTTSSVLSTTSTPAQQEVRAVAFIIDMLGNDDYAFNQTFMSMAQYYKLFKYTHYVMIIGNLNVANEMSITFQQYPNETSILAKNDIFFSYRSTETGGSNVSLALTKIQQSYADTKTKIQSPVSLNIFYLTQIGLKDDDDVITAFAGLEDFQKASIVYSPFAKDADPAVPGNLTRFSPNVTSTRDYYGGLVAMKNETSANAHVVLPDKPPTASCVYSLQSNVRVAIDRSLPSSADIETALSSFLSKFKVGFNFIENDEARCASEDPLPKFYNGRTAMTAFPYYDTYVQSSKFCPSQYAAMQSFPITGANSKPTYSDKLVQTIGKQINSSSCVCNRYADTKTIKVVVWLPRSSGQVTTNYLNYLKLGTDNAYHFVVPFYDVTDKDNDLYYQILASQPKGADYYLLPNAATATDIQKDVIDILYDKICQTAGVDPTAVPPLLSAINTENRNQVDY